jgi:ATP-dependent Clp protease ATP-binding subunit ClpC
MIERFTDRARKVVVLAHEEATRLNHNEIGTEHILLGLIGQSESVAAQVLASLGLDLAAVRREVEELIGQGTHAPSGHIPYTPRARKVLDLSLREALYLRHNYIGTEHILLGLIREGDGAAAQILLKLGVDLNLARRQVIELPAGSAADVTGAGGTESVVGQPAGITPVAADIDPPSLAEKVRELSEEVERLRGLLGQDGPEPDEGTA